MSEVTPGETVYHPRTPEQVAADTNAPVLDARLSDALAALRAFVAAAKPATAAAQASAAYDATKTICRVLVALIRHRLARYDGAD